MALPYTLEEKSIRERLRLQGGVDVLNGLADRGVYLNNWQINELLLGGNRGYGKSHLGYVKIALQYATTGFSISTDDDLQAFDEDATSITRKQTFINELYVFLAEHYADVFILNRINSRTLVATIRPSATPSKRWWNK